MEPMTKKERIEKYGEVFTPDWLVDQMLDDLEAENPDAFAPSTTYLEPTCGDGAFLCGILRRKFARCKLREDFRTAIRSVWAMEIQADNVEAAIQNVTDLCASAFKLTKEDREIIRDHIIQADALKVMRLLSEIKL